MYTRELQLFQTLNIMTPFTRHTNNLCIALGLAGALAAITCFFVHLFSYNRSDSASQEQVSTNAPRSGFWKGTKRSLD